MATDSTLTTPYATAMPFVSGNLQTWLGEYEAQRLASYDLYDDLFHNLPDTAVLMLRGTDDQPIYLPTAKRLINTLARYVAKGWGFATKPVEFDESGDPVAVEKEEYDAAVRQINALFRRERLLAKVTSGKKGFLRRGDWVWMISADSTKLPGSRISISEIDPRTYFPIQDDPTDLDRVTGCEIVEEGLELDGTTFHVSVQRWIKAGHQDYEDSWGGDIAYVKEVYALQDYDNIEKRKLLRTETPLDSLPGLRALPLYHIRNNEIGGDPYGRSDLSGLETLIAGINQSMSDEDLALAISGLGMFWTDSGAPVDEEGNPVNWKLGPQEVVEVVTGGSFNRVEGISSVEPSQTHTKSLQSEAYGTVGVSDVAMGTATQVEAGISLALKLSPVFDAADEKDMAINGVWTQLLHDLLRDWFPAYESIDMSMVEISSKTENDDRMPFDRDARFTELMALFNAGLVSAQFVHNELNDKFGYQISATEAGSAVADIAARSAAADPYAARGNAELDAEDEDETE